MDIKTEYKDLDVSTVILGLCRGITTNPLLNSRREHCHCPFFPLGSLPSTPSSMKSLILTALTFVLHASASVIRLGNEEAELSVTRRPRQATSCENSATSRNCWGDYSTDTNYYTTIPDTGVTREYWLSVEDGNCAPDGYQRTCMTFNGTVPGPTIIVRNT